MTEPLSIANLRINSGNMRFLPLLVEAAQSHSIPVAVLATIITAEAQMRPAEGDVTWDELSYNELGLAAGLAQFTQASWLAHARRPGGMLNALGMSRGIISPQGEILDEPALLDIRYDPRMSLQLTAESARRNLDILNAKGLAPETMGAGALAKIVYLAHHEGAEGAYRYLIGARPAVSRERFESNVPPKQWPQDRSQASLVACYFRWLENYIDRRIDIRRYLLDSGGVDVPRLAALGRAHPYLLLKFWLRNRKVAAVSRAKRGVGALRKNRA